MVWLSSACWMLHTGSAELHSSSSSPNPPKPKERKRTEQRRNTSSEFRRSAQQHLFCERRRPTHHPRTKQCVRSNGSSVEPDVGPGGAQPIHSGWLRKVIELRLRPCEQIFKFHLASVCTSHVPSCKRSSPSYVSRT